MTQIYDNILEIQLSNVERANIQHTVLGDKYCISRYTKLMINEYGIETFLYLHGRYDINLMREYVKDGEKILTVYIKDNRHMVYDMKNEDIMSILNGKKVKLKGYKPSNELIMAYDFDMQVFGE